jgi:hypothetical protein
VAVYALNYAKTEVKSIKEKKPLSLTGKWHFEENKHPFILGILHLFKKKRKKKKSPPSLWESGELFGEKNGKSSPLP